MLYYLHGTPTLGITLRCNESTPSIHIYSDAAYGIRSIDRLSQTGICVRIGEATVIARSGRQGLVTKSSTEAELVACSDSIVYGLIVRNIISELGINHNGITLFQDNMSTIQLINNARSTSIRTKHIDIKYFFLRNRKDLEPLNVVHCPTALMIADLLTKPIQGAQFNTLRQMMMNCDVRPTSTTNQGWR